MADKRIRAWLFRDGQYPDKDVPVADLAFLKRYADNTNAAQAPVPFDIEHGPTEGVLDFARVAPGSLRVEYGRPPGTPTTEDGHWITADVDIDEAVDQRLKHRGLSVFLDLAKHVIEKVAVTKSPRVASARFSDEGRTHLEFSGGQLMGVNTETPGQEPELSDGFVAGLRKRLGLDQAAETPAAVATPATTPATAPAFADDAAFANDPRTKALLSRIEAVEQQAKAAETTATQTAEQARQSRIEAYSADLKRDGVPFHVVDLLAPVAEGVVKHTVAFSGEDGKTTTAELSAAESARRALETLRGSVPMELRVPADNDRHTTASFSQQVEGEIANLQKANPALTWQDAYEQAKTRVRERGVQES